MKAVLFALLLLTLPAHARLCDISPFAELEKVAEAPVETYQQCFRSLGDNPASPPYSRQQFQKLGEETVYALGCNMYLDGEESYDRYLFLTRDGLKVLRFPIYRYPESGETTELPRNVIHFKVGAQDNYMVIGIDGQPKLFGAGKIPQISQETGDSVTKIQNTYVRRYEQWLAGQGKAAAINLALAKDDDLSPYLTCLEERARESSKDYLSQKFAPSFVSYNTMVADHNAYQGLGEERKKLYQLSWAEKKAAVLKDFAEAHPSCTSFVNADAIFDAYWGQNKELYEGLHKRWYP